MKTFLTNNNFTLILMVCILLQAFACKKSALIEEPVTDVYISVSPEEILKDTPVVPKSASASENQPGEDIQKALDGDYETIYHSICRKPEKVSIFFP